MLSIHFSKSEETKDLIQYPVRLKRFLTFKEHDKKRIFVESPLYYNGDLSCSCMINDPITNRMVFSKMKVRNDSKSMDVIDRYGFTFKDFSLIKDNKRLVSCLWIYLGVYNHTDTNDTEITKKFIEDYSPIEHRAFSNHMEYYKIFIARKQKTTDEQWFQKFIMIPLRIDKDKKRVYFNEQIKYMNTSSNNDWRQPA